MIFSLAQSAVIIPKMPKITDMIDFRASHFFGGLLFEKYSFYVRALVHFKDCNEIPTSLKISNQVF